MRRLLKNIFVFVALSFLIVWLLTNPINKIGIERPYLAAPETGHVFYDQELNDFVLLLAKIEHSYVKKYMNNASMQENGSISWTFKRWLDLHDWNPERFLYCEQRLKALLKCAGLQRNYQDNMKISQTQNIPLSDIIKDQQKKLSSCSFDPTEFKMVINNYDNIIRFLNHQPNEKE